MIQLIFISNKKFSNLSLDFGYGDNGLSLPFSLTFDFLFP